jgi:co-chaperonin GroES (HSP10)
VEAEVVAVGPGRLGKDSTLINDLTDALEFLWEAEVLDDHVRHESSPRYLNLIERARNRHTLIPLQVKPGDRILYHPSVQRFDRKIDPSMIGLPDTEECYIISEQTSVLAVLERE